MVLDGETLEQAAEEANGRAKAAVNIFGKSYEYTRKYREFVKMMKEIEKEEKKRLNE